MRLGLYKTSIKLPGSLSCAGHMLHCCYFFPTLGNWCDAAKADLFLNEVFHIPRKIYPLTLRYDYELCLFLEADGSCYVHDDFVWDFLYFVEDFKSRDNFLQRFIDAPLFKVETAPDDMEVGIVNGYASRILCGSKRKHDAVWVVTRVCGGFSSDKLLLKYFFLVVLYKSSLNRSSIQNGDSVLSRVEVLAPTCHLTSVSYEKTLPVQR
ncbi:hypothetical protein B0H10DRAFT_2213678 [Mycena sp. CBHHK59/15]|nr:hypothetical protein B0H10DRAFT_2213678 [Mycena sp. CBHHK59/15]